MDLIDSGHWPVYGLHEQKLPRLDKTKLLQSFLDLTEHASRHGALSILELARGFTDTRIGVVSEPLTGLISRVVLTLTKIARSSFPTTGKEIYSIKLHAIIYDQKLNLHAQEGRHFWVSNVFSPSSEL